MVNIADEYGIESANISRKLFPAAGFEIVYDKSYPLGTQDYSPVIKAAKATNPDAFIAYSYPPDTFGLTDQAKIENLKVKAYYNGIGCAFAGFAGKYGAAAENVIGFGGMPDNEKTRAFLKATQGGHRHRLRLQRLLLHLCQRTGANPGIRRRRHGGSRGRHRLSQKPYVQNSCLARSICAASCRTSPTRSGQWQNGFFRSVAAVGAPASELVPVRVKTGWA